MAYDYGLLNIVNLIDIFNSNTDTKIVKYLARRYLKERHSHTGEESGTTSDSLYHKRIQIGQSPQLYSKNLLSIDAKLLQNQQTTDNIGKDENKKSLSNEDNLYKEIDEAKPPSVFINVFNSEFERDQNSISTNSSQTSDSVKEMFTIKPEKVQKDLNKNIMNIINKPNRVQSTQISLSALSKKSLKYDGYKLNLTIKNEKCRDPSPHNSDSSLSNYTRNNKSITQCSTRFISDTKSVIKSEESIKAINEDLQGPNLPFKYSKISESNVYYNKNETYYTKKNEKILKLNHHDMTKISKQLTKLNNFYYLNSLSKRTAARPVIDELLKSKYSDPVFPLTENYSNEKVEDASLVKNIKKLNFNKNLQEPKNQEKLKPKSILSFSTKNERFYFKSQDQILDSYFSSLKKSNQVNKNTLPILKNNKILTRTQSLIRAKS